MNEINWETEWEDDDFGQEYIKFRQSNQFNCANPSPNLFVLFLKPDYSSIISYENDWRKKRKRVRVQEIRIMAGTPYTEDLISDNSNLWLDMGARLYQVIKKCYKEKWTFIQVIKSTNAMDKFDVWYDAFQYKIQKQTKITKK